MDLKRSIQRTPSVVASFVKYEALKRDIARAPSISQFFSAQRM
jgi:hypothetical protein